MSHSGVSDEAMDILRGAETRDDARRQNTNSKRPFRIEDLPSIWTLDAKTEWLVEGLIPAGAITLLTGESGVGKSTFSLALAGSVAHGTPFLNSPTRRSSTLYVDGENPVGTVRDRLDRLQIQSTTDLYMWGGWSDQTPEGPHAPSVIEFARQHRGLLVFDSLIGFHPGSEQDSSETRRYLQHYRKLANTGASVVLIHHTGKGESSKQYRGSSDIKAAVDQAYCLDLASENEEGMRTLRLTPFKNRIAEVAPMFIEWSSTGFALGRATSRSNREIILQIVGQNPRQTSGYIVKLAVAEGVAKNRAETMLNDGARDGWLQCIEGLRNARLFQLPELDSE